MRHQFRHLLDLRRLFLDVPFVQRRLVGIDAGVWLANGVLQEQLDGGQVAAARDAQQHAHGGHHIDVGDTFEHHAFEFGLPAVVRVAGTAGVALGEAAIRIAAVIAVVRRRVGVGVRNIGVGGSVHRSSLKV